MDKSESQSDSSLCSYSVLPVQAQSDEELMVLVGEWHWAVTEISAKEGYLSSGRKYVFYFFFHGGPPPPPLSRPGGLRDSRIYSIRYNKNSLCITKTILQIQQE